MSLAQLQRDLSAWLQADKPADSAPFGARARPGLAIYQNNFRAQIAACLEDSFDKTRQWISGEFFHEAIVHHLERVPPSSWTLDAYPRDFPATLAMLYPIDPEVAELAALELALADAFVGADAPRLTADQVATADWDSVTLLFTPTLDLLPMTTNAATIWTALTEESAPPISALLPTAGALLVWRDGETPRFRVIEAMEERAILHIRGGMTFARLCAELVDVIGEAEGVSVAGAWLGQWLADGLLSEIID